MVSCSAYMFKQVMHMFHLVLVVSCHSQLVHYAVAWVTVKAQGHLVTLCNALHYD